MILLELYYIKIELSHCRPPIVIIRISKFKVGVTYICTTAHFIHYKICYSNTILYRPTLGYNAAKKNIKIKPNQRNQTTPK